MFDRPAEGAFDRLAERTPPMAAVGVAIAAVSTSAILVRWSSAPPSVAALYRVLFTTLLLAPFAATTYRRELLGLARRDAAVAAITGVVLAAHFAAWFQSVEWTSVAASVTLVQSQTLFVTLGAGVLLGEGVGRRAFAGVAVAFAGIVAMSLGDVLAGATLAGSRPLLGNLLALVGAVMAAGYVLAGRSLRQRVALVPYVVVVYSVCSAALAAFVLVRGHALGSYPPHEWLIFLGMAVGPGVVGHTVLNWALAHLESSVVSVSLLGEPVGSTLLAVWLVSEVPSAMTVLGGTVVLAGIYLTARARV